MVTMTTMDISDRRSGTGSNSNPAGSVRGSANGSDDTANSSISYKIRGGSGGQKVQARLNEWRAKLASEGVAHAGGSGRGRNSANKVTVTSIRRAEPASGAGAGAGRSDVGEVAGTGTGGTVDMHGEAPGDHARTRSAGDSRSGGESSRSSMVGSGNSARTGEVSRRHGDGPERGSERRGPLASSSRKSGERGVSDDRGAPKVGAGGGDPVFAASIAADAAGGGRASSRESGRSSSIRTGGSSNRREHGGSRDRETGRRHHDREKSQERSNRSRESREHGDADGESVGNKFGRSQHGEHDRESSRGQSSRRNFRERLEVTPYRRRDVPGRHSREVSQERSSRGDSSRERSRSTDHRRRGSDSSREGHSVRSESTGRRGRRSSSEASSGTGTDSHSRGHSYDSLASMNSSRSTKRTPDYSFFRRKNEPTRGDETRETTLGAAASGRSENQRSVWSSRQSRRDPDNLLEPRGTVPSRVEAQAGSRRGTSRERRARKTDRWVGSAKASATAPSNRTGSNGLHIENQAPSATAGGSRSGASNAAARKELRGRSRVSKQSDEKRRPSDGDGAVGRDTAKMKPLDVNGASPDDVAVRERNGRSLSAPSPAAAAAAAARAAAIGTGNQQRLDNRGSAVARNDPRQGQVADRNSGRVGVLSNSAYERPALKGIVASHVEVTDGPADGRPRHETRISSPFRATGATVGRKTTSPGKDTAADLPAALVSKKSSSRRWLPGGSDRKTRRPSIAHADSPASSPPVQGMDLGGGDGGSGVGPPLPPEAFDVAPDGRVTTRGGGSAAAPTVTPFFTSKSMVLDEQEGAVDGVVEVAQPAHRQGSSSTSSSRLPSSADGAAGVVGGEGRGRGGEAALRREREDSDLAAAAAAAAAIVHAAVASGRAARLTDTEETITAAAPTHAVSENSAPGRDGPSRRDDGRDASSSSNKWGTTVSDKQPDMHHMSRNRPQRPTSHTAAGAGAGETSRPADATAATVGEDRRDTSAEAAPARGMSRERSPGQREKHVAVPAMAAAAGKSAGPAGSGAAAGAGDVAGGGNVTAVERSGPAAASLVQSTGAAASAAAAADDGGYGPTWDKLEVRVLFARSCIFCVASAVVGRFFFFLLRVTTQC